MKKIGFLLVSVFLMTMSFVPSYLQEKEWEEIGTAGGVHFSWRCNSAVAGELKLKNMLEHPISVSGGFEIHDLEKAIIEDEFQFDEISPQTDKITIFTDSTLKRLEFVTGIRLKKLDIRKVE